MSYTEYLSLKEIKKSKKVHQCVWCGEDINIGESYMKFVNIFEGDFHDDRYHPECWDALGRSKYDEYPPCSNPRGKTNEEQDVEEWEAKTAEQKEKALAGAFL